MKWAVDRDYNDLDALKVLAALIGFWLGLPMLVQALIAFMAVDLVMGALVAVSQRRWASMLSLIGITRKVVILVLVATVGMVDHYIGATNVPLMGAAAGFYIVHEIFSILEHASAAGVVMPSPLKDYFVGVIRRLEKGNWNAW